jgi:hypothetical protein
VPVEHQRRASTVAGEHPEHVRTSRLDLLHGHVELELAEHAGHSLGHCPLVAGRARNRHELDRKVDQLLLVDRAVQPSRIVGH